MLYVECVAIYFEVKSEPVGTHRKLYILEPMFYIITYNKYDGLS